MDALETIFNRHSIPILRPDPVPHEMVERLLAAAVQAPNHFHLRPWRFAVLQGPARERLGDVLADILKEAQPNLTTMAYDKERTKPLRAPLIIAVGVERSDDPRSNPIEDMCAAAAACENLLLAAHALGLAGIWRTGPPASIPRVKHFLGFNPDQPLIAFLYLGYPTEQAAQPAPRPSFEDRTTWL